MAGEFPLPVRVVAGALATGFDRLRRVPQDLPGLSVTVAGQAGRASMRTVPGPPTSSSSHGDATAADPYLFPTVRLQQAVEIGPERKTR